jgi:uroporphyrinogen III methyltransferase / synthase
VVRLKGGDPFVFGRGAEEAATLKKNRIPFEVVPGITSAIAVPAYAGIPVTHRDYASGFAVVTAYEDPSKKDFRVNYQSLVRFPGTLLFLMGVIQIRSVTEQLIACGKSPSTPVAMIRWGTRGFQQALTGTLQNIAELVEKKDFRPPAVVVIGDVVKCRKQIQWFENLPLFGKRVVVTRTREQASELSRRLMDLGAEVIELPTIQIEPVQSQQVSNSIRNVKSYDWIVFTSPWAARFFLDEVLKFHADLRVLSGIQFAAIGPATASILRERGLSVQFQSRIHTSQALGKGLGSLKKIPGARILISRSEIADREIESKLRRAGARVRAVTFYRNVRPKPSWELQALYRFGADFVTFTSSSTAENFVRLVGKEWLRKARKKLQCVSIGPSTSKTLRSLGISRVLQAKTASMEALVQRIAGV